MGKIYSYSELKGVLKVGDRVKAARGHKSECYKLNNIGECTVTKLEGDIMYIDGCSHAMSGDSYFLEVISEEVDPSTIGQAAFDAMTPTEREKYLARNMVFFDCKVGSFEFQNVTYFPHCGGVLLSDFENKYMWRNSGKGKSNHSKMSRILDYGWFAEFCAIEDIRLTAAQFGGKVVAFTTGLSGGYQEYMNTPMTNVSDESAEVEMPKVSSKPGIKFNITLKNMKIAFKKFVSKAIQNAVKAGYRNDDLSLTFDGLNLAIECLLANNSKAQAEFDATVAAELKESKK